jgi:pimeloyl-ACP methyl ester carboxylesterase
MQLNFKQLGQGKPLVLLHGLFGSADNWFSVAPKLAERFHVVAADLRNHGHSPHDAEMTYPLMAADVAELFDTCGFASASIVGHSMGGKVAIQFALDFPERVNKLVVVDIAPRAYARSHDNILDALLSLNLADFNSRQEMENSLASQIPSLYLRRFLLKSIGRNDAGQFYWKMNLQAIAANYSRLCEAIGAGRSFAGPTLFLRGGKSDYVNTSDEAEIRRQFPAAKFDTIASASHWVHADTPGEFVNVVLDYL